MLLLLVGCLAPCAPRSAGAATLESLLSPGDLSRAHQKYESDCSQCHDRSDRARQTQLCAGCHKEVAADVRAGRGFHGRRAAGGIQCSACHSEHLGRDARLVSLLPASFDHSQTDFPLDGRHRGAACESCHKTGKRFAEAPGRCVDCHRQIEPHAGRLGEDCASCHDASGWKTIRFDHSKTRFALDGKHAQAPCACHRTGRYEDKLPRDCAGCHATTDTHAGRLGTRCESCHAETQWSQTHFDHDRDTRFALAGAHRDVECHTCHTAAIATQKLGQECASCHRRNDVHGGALGQDCGACHQPTSWRKDVAFDHDQTRFPLLGLHSAVACGQCHATRDYAKTPSTCHDCHATRDVHHGGLGERCERCHTPNDWHVWEFDHRHETGFALEGAHARATCAACHREPATQVKLSRDCGACHQQDDVHLGQFGRQCARCHDTSTFRRARARQTP